MFLVATYLAPSPIAGTGVFAGAPIPAGTVIWEFVEGVDWALTPDQLAAFPEPYQGQLRRWCFLNDDGIYVLCGDSAKFMNHADAPNCDDPEWGAYTVTNRDVAAGEELTCDYRTFDRESADQGDAFDPAAS